MIAITVKMMKLAMKMLWNSLASVSVSPDNERGLSPSAILDHSVVLWPCGRHRTSPARLGFSSRTAARRGCTNRTAHEGERNGAIGGGTGLRENRPLRFSGRRLAPGHRPHGDGLEQKRCEAHCEDQPVLRLVEGPGDRRSRDRSRTLSL
jgi:hypothetical protein